MKINVAQGIKKCEFCLWNWDFFSPHTEKKKQIMRKFSNNTKKIPHFKIVFSL